ncbi:Kinesin-like protein KIN-8A, partial [Cucurbita argyrosperma subsp. sororia]
MPVSTRSQIMNEGQNEATSCQEDKQHLNLPPRNLHHGLKEKMKALTLLYEQQKLASAALKRSSPKGEDLRFTTHPSVELKGCCKKEVKEAKLENVMRENAMPNSTVTRTYVLPQPPMADAKENVGVGTDRIVGFSCSRKASELTSVARKLSLGNSMAVMEEKENVGCKNMQEMEEFGSSSEKESSGKTRILVFVRLRPMGKREKEAGSRCCVKIVNGRDLYLTEFANENDYLRLKRLRGRHFTFDASFPDTTNQKEVYSTTTAEVVEGVLQGRNGSVFCYGATGAGKTYTMLGTVENPGVMVLAIKDLFTKIRQRSCDGNHAVHLSYIEVYNETVRDLLSPGRPLVLREDKQGIVAAGLTQYRAYSTDEVMALLQRGNQNRTTEPTRVNETSSRSHAILQVTVEYQARDGGMNVVNRVGKLSLIDLAGPSNLSFGETQNTLHWADRAKEIRTKIAEANEEIMMKVPESESDQAKLLLELQKENRELRVQLVRQQQKLLTLQAQSLAAVASSTPSSATSLLTPPTSVHQNERRKPRSSFLNGNCFTPESRKKGAEEAVRELRRTVKQLEAELEKTKKEHIVELKHKDDLINELLKKGEKATGTRSSLRPKEPSVGELKSPSHRFKSPAPTAKKRSFWDITTTNSPSVATLNGRKTRSHVLAEPPTAAPSLLRQPGFARQKP